MNLLFFELGHFVLIRIFVPALSTILENTAFLGDIVLRLPDVAHELLDGNEDWKLLTQWAIDFTNDTDIFVDKDRQLISMVCYLACMLLCYPVLKHILTLVMSCLISCIWFVVDILISCSINV